MSEAEDAYHAMKLRRQRDSCAPTRPVEQRVVKGWQGEAEQLVIPIDRWSFGIIVILSDRLECAHNVGKRVFVRARVPLELWRRMGLQRV